MLQLETEAQVALREAADNFPKPIGALGGWLMTAGIAPLGELMRPYRPPRDALTQEVSRLLTTPSEVSKMFAENVYTPDDPKLIAEADALRDKLVQVDVHEALGPLEDGHPEYERPALVSTVQRQQKGAASFEAAVAAGA